MDRESEEEGLSTCWKKQLCLTQQGGHVTFHFSFICLMYSSLSFILSFPTLILLFPFPWFCLHLFFFVTSYFVRMCIPPHDFVRLKPYSGKNGLLRVGGQLKDHWMEEQEGPIIISQDQPVTALVVRDAQVRTGHSGKEYTLALV